MELLRPQPRIGCALHECHALAESGLAAGQHQKRVLTFGRRRSRPNHDFQQGSTAGAKGATKFTRSGPRVSYQRSDRRCTLLIGQLSADADLCAATICHARSRPQTQCGHHGDLCKKSVYRLDDNQHNDKISQLIAAVFLLRLQISSLPSGHKAPGAEEELKNGS